MGQTIERVPSGRLFSRHPCQPSRSTSIMSCSSGLTTTHPKPDHPAPPLGARPSATPYAVSHPLADGSTTWVRAAGRGLGWRRHAPAQPTHPRTHHQYQALRTAPRKPISGHPRGVRGRLRWPRARTLRQAPRRSGEHARSRCPGLGRSGRVGPCSRGTGRR
jgi:hypothetical protein